MTRIEIEIVALSDTAAIMQMIRLLNLAKIDAEKGDRKQGKWRGTYLRRGPAGYTVGGLAGNATMTVIDAIPTKRPKKP